MSTPPRTVSDAEILALIRAVALHANEDAPTTVSRRRFDAAREPAGHAQCPGASNLCRRFSSDWRKLLELAFRGETSFHTTSIRARAKSRHEGAGTDRRTCVAALVLIALRLGVRTLRPEQYDDERRALLASARGARRAALGGRLPTVGQFGPFGTWDELLISAGLQGRPRRSSRAGIPVADAVERFLTAQGYLGRRRDLERLAREQGFALERATAAELDAAGEQLRERRAAQGLWTPPKTSPRAKRPPWTEPGEELADATSPISAAPRLRRGYWTLALVEDGLQRAVTQLGPGDRLNQPTLRRLAKADRSIPSPSVLGRLAAEHGTTFRKLRDEAIARQAER